MHTPRFIRIAATGLGLLVAVLGALCLALVLALQTPWAKNALAEWASRETGGYRMEVTGLGGFLPFTATADEVTLADEEGEFLRVQDVRLGWSPGQLAKGTLLLREVSAARMTLQRMPAAPTKRGTESSGSRPPPFDVVVRELRVPRLELGRGILGPDAVVAAVEGQIAVRGRQVDASLRVEDAPLASLFPGTTPSDEGILSAKARIDGTFAKFALTVNGRARRVGFGPLKPSALSFHLHAPALPSELAARGRLQLTANGRSVSLNARAAYRNKVLLVEPLSLTAPKTRMEGAVELRTREKTVHGRLKGSADRLSWLRAFVDVPLSGTLTANMEIDGRWEQPALSGEIQGEQLRVGPVAVGSLKLKGTPTDETPASRAATLRITDIETNGVVVDKAVLVLHPRNRGTKVQLDLSGSARLPFSLTTEGTLQLRSIPRKLVLTTAEGRYGPLPLSWSQSAKLAFGHGAWSVSAPGLSVGGGSAELDAEIANGRVDAAVSVEADLESFAPLFLPPGQRLAGKAQGDFRLIGAAKHPRVGGNLGVADGEYENAHSGTLLTNIELSAEAQDRTLTIRRFSARGEEKGAASASGTVRFPPGETPRIDVTATCEALKALNTENASATITGTATVRMSDKRAEISGDLTADSAELRIPDPSPQAMQGIVVVREGEAADQPDETPVQETGGTNPWSQAALDIDIAMANQCFVRGRGLDSEWEGNLTVRGTAGQPAINGEARLVRGHVNFLTKRFQLSKGIIHFQEETPPRPLLDIRARHEAKNLNAELHVTGTAANPDFTLSSNPEYPRDEILARLLFGRGLEEISPVQAVKIALAVRTLTSGGTSIVDSVRAGLGLATLQLQTTGNEQGGTVVGVGKYLTEDVYFEVERGAAQESGRVTVEVELTPNISVETEAGAARQGVDLQWQYRY